MSNNITNTFIKSVCFIMIVILLSFIMYKLFYDHGLIDNNFTSLPADKVEISSNTRIVSFGPSITELIYKLGLEDQLVGNTEYCNYPEEAKNITKIGSLFNIYYELLLALNADMAIVYENSEEHHAVLENLGIQYIKVNHNSIDSIINSIKYVGDIFNKENEAKEIINDINNKMSNMMCSSQQKKKVIYIVHRDVDFGSSSNITVVGKDTYFNNMIDMVGGVNVFNNANVAYPIVDMEAIIRTNPDIIIETYLKKEDINSLKNNWKKNNNISAVKNDEIHFFNVEDYSIPGPRFINVMSSLHDIICEEK